MAIRNRLPDLMRQRKLSYRKVQKATGLPYATVYAHCSGKAHMIDFRTLDTLCKFFALTPGWILEWVPDDRSDAPTPTKDEVDALIQAVGQLAQSSQHSPVS